MREDAILSPSQVGQYLKNMMDRDRLLSRLLVRGELSNYKMYPSGHHYFTLKDGEGSLRCVMFRSDAQYLRFRPENGMQVIAAGRVSLDHAACLKPDKQVGQGAVLTARGLGKAKLIEVGGLTKKGRVGIVIERYL